MNKRLLFPTISIILVFVICGISLTFSQTGAFATNDVQEENNFGESQSQCFSNVSNGETVIYFTNDVHGNFTNVNSEGGGMSYATVKGLKDKSTNEGNTAFLVDAGDHVSGSSYANFTSGDDIMKITNLVDYDFRVPGNHEIDYGTSLFFDSFVKQAKYYACNFYSGSITQRGKNLLDSYKIVDGANGEKIALIGIMTPETISATAPGYFQDDEGNWVMYIDNPQAPYTNAIYDRVNQTIAEVKNQYGQNTICIGVGHCGNDDKSVSAGIDSKTIIQQSSGLAAFIDGHSHKIYNESIADKDGNQVLLAQAASGLQAGSSETTGVNRIGKLSISNTTSGVSSIHINILDKDSDEVKSVLTPTGSATAVAEKEKEVIAKVDSTLGKSVALNNIDTTESVGLQRIKSNNLGDLVADNVLYFANTSKDREGKIVGADAAIMNGGGIRNALPEGEVKLKDCLAILPFVNQIAVVELTGQQLLDALEYSAYLYPESFGGYLQVAGIQYYINDQVSSTVQTDGYVWLGPPTGQYRVNGVQIYDKTTETYNPIDLSKKYKVAGTDFLVANYGNGYLMFKGSTRYAFDNYLLYQSFAQYISNFKTEENSDLSHIASKNSPIFDFAGYRNYKINYEELKGAERAKIGIYAPDPQPEPKPDPLPISDNDSSSDMGSSIMSATTGDNNIYALIFILAIISASLALAQTSRKLHLDIKD